MNNRHGSVRALGFLHQQKRQRFPDSIGEYRTALRIATSHPMHFQPLRQLPNHGYWRSALASFGIRDSAIPNGAGNVYSAFAVIFPQQPLYLAVPQTHEGCYRERCGGRLGQHAEDALYLLKRIGIGFLRLSGLRIDRRVAGRVLALKIILLLRQRENAAVVDTAETMLICSRETRL